MSEYEAAGTRDVDESGEPIVHLGDGTFQYASLVREGFAVPADLAPPVEVAEPKRERKSRVAPPLFTIAQDGAEQMPLDFSPWVARGMCHVQPKVNLFTGDYSIVGYEGVVTVERKSLSDLIACTGRERERFTKCLERMEKMHHAKDGYACLLIEASWAEILAGIEQSSVSGKCAVGSIIAWSADYGLPVWVADDRRIAAAICHKVLSKWYKRVVAAPAKLRGWSKL